MTDVWRIEGSGVDPELNEGLSARIADPLWLLARQWQVGEFRGEDAASPVSIKAVVDTYPVNSVLTNKGRHKISIGEPGDPVLEGAVERDLVHTVLSYQDRLEAGASLLAALRRDERFDGQEIAARFAGNKAYRLRVPKSDGNDVGLARMQLLANSTPDARKVFNVVKKSGSAALKEIYDLNSSEIQAVIEVVELWMASEEDLVSVGDKASELAWRQRSQDYAFEVVAEVEGQNPIRLSAGDYPGGHLDWHQFDYAKGPEKWPANNEYSINVLASPLRFPGQPALRFWEIENGSVHFGNLAGGPGDLARSILAAYATVAGDDWFVVPLRLPTGVVARVRSVEVLDNFESRTHSIASTARIDHLENAERVWRWFELAGSVDSDPEKMPLLWLPPALLTNRQGEVLEEIRYRRDDMANLAWAIERIYEGVDGRPITRDMPVPTEPPKPRNPEDWVYQLGTEVPGHFFPLVPVRINSGGGQIALRRGVMAVDPETKPTVPRGVVLSPGKPFVLDEAEVPHGGAAVTRRYQLARSADGSVHLWNCLLYTSPSPRDATLSRMPSSA